MINEVNNSYAEVLVGDEMLEMNEPHLYQVNLLNDDYTPMAFVVAILQRFFLMPQTIAAKVMYQAHQQGSAACGVYSKDVADTKVTHIADYIKQFHYPLRFNLEPLG